MIGTSAKLKYGDTLSVYDMLFALMLPSGNDAAYALAVNYNSNCYKSLFLWDYLNIHFIMYFLLKLVIKLYLYYLLYFIFHRSILEGYCI